MEVRTHGDALDFGVGIGYGEIVEEEHAVERLGEELKLRLFVNWLGLTWSGVAKHTRMYPAIKMASPT